MALLTTTVEGRQFLMQGFQTVVEYRLIFQRHIFKDGTRRENVTIHHCVQHPHHCRKKAENRGGKDKWLQCCDVERSCFLQFHFYVMMKPFQFGLTVVFIYFGDFF